MIRKRLIKILTILSISVFSLVGCRGNNENILFDTSVTVIDKQYSTLGIDLKEKGSKLTQGFYVLHDGIYYPVVYGSANYDLEEGPSNTVNTNKQLYFTVQDEYYIPTLFLDKGDKLIYYDEFNVLDNIYWERYKDLGYTLGLYNLTETVSGRYYINVEDGNGIIPDGGLNVILEDVSETNDFLIDKIGNTTVSSKIVKNGLITGATRLQEYSLDVYNGTQYHHYTALANVHAFSAFEQFASIEYKTLRAYTYEIEVPDYLVDGYYRLYGNTINNSIPSYVLRIVKGKSFDLTDTDRFNKELLLMYTPEDLLAIKNGKEISKNKGTYSTYEKLNTYETKVIGSLGYKSKQQDKVTETAKKVTLSPATVRQFNIKCPKDINYRIELQPREIEPAGDIYIYIGSKKDKFTYDAINNIYVYENVGDDNTYTLFISGIWGSYNILLVDCSQDKETPSSSKVPEKGTLIKFDDYKNSEDKENFVISKDKNNTIIRNEDGSIIDNGVTYKDMQEWLDSLN